MTAGGSEAEPASDFTASTTAPALVMSRSAEPGARTSAPSGARAASSRPSCPVPPGIRSARAMSAPGQLRAVLQRLPPRPVVAVPLDGARQALVEGHQRAVAQLGREFGAVHGVAPVRGRAHL